MTSTRRLTVAATLLVVALAAGLVLSAGGDAPDDDLVSSVPASARLYAHAQPDANGWDELRAAAGRVPALAGAGRELLAALGLPDTIREETAVAWLPSGGRVALTEPGGPAAGAEPGDVAVVERTAEGEVPSLAALPDYRRLVGLLPDERAAHLYLAPRAAAPLRRLDASVRSAAAALAVDEELTRLAVRVRHAGEPGACIRDRPGGRPLDSAPAGTALFVEVSSVACVLRSLREGVAGARPAFERFARAADRRGGVSFDDELMPLLDRRGALVASPGETAPVLTMVVEGVDEEQALDMLARLQPALVALLGGERLGQAPVFGATEVEGVTAVTAQLAPGLELSYAAWDGRLVAATALEGIAAARRGERLRESEPFAAVADDPPSDAAALVFLDFDQLLALGEQTGLAADARYLAVRDDLQKLRAVGGVIARERELTTAELIFHTP